MCACNLSGILDNNHNILKNLTSHQKNPEIYLFDDPLSAVDAHVGKNIFNNLILNNLREKNRILVTHQLQYLSKVDYIYVLKDGEIHDEGTYNQLMENRDGEFSIMIREHVSDLENFVDDDVGEVEEEEERQEKQKDGDEGGKIIASEEREV